MLSLSSRGFARLVSATAVGILLILWSFSHWDLPFNTNLLRRPWSSPDTVPDDQEQGCSEYACLSDGLSPSPVAVEYQSIEANSSEAAEQAKTPSQAPCISAVQTITLLLASPASTPPAALTTSTAQFPALSTRT